MLSKETQDHLWKCALPEVREYARKHQDTNKKSNFDTGFNCAIKSIFGHHNLTSEVEPEEMISISRKSVIEKYAEIFWNKAPYLDSSTEALSCQACLNVLKDLFGSKCLPDELGHELGQTSVQVEGSKVEPKFKVGNKVRIIKQSNPLYNKTATVDTLVKGVYPEVLVNCRGNLIAFNESDLEPYTEPTNDNMEEKELNLCEILKGHEGEEFYSLMHGNIRYMTNSAEGFVMFDYPESISLYPNGKYDENAEVILYPSREAYLKYPLDARTAWMEWQEEQKPKRWHPKNGGPYWFVNFNTLRPEQSLRSNSGFNWEEDLNHFQTKELAQQASEAVQECLMKFHENNK